MVENSSHLYSGQLLWRYILHEAAVESPRGTIRQPAHTPARVICILQQQHYNKDFWNYIKYLSRSWTLSIWIMLWKLHHIYWSWSNNFKIVRFNTAFGYYKLFKCKILTIHVSWFLFHLANFSYETAFTERQLSFFQGFIARHSFLDQDPTKRNMSILISIESMVVNTGNNWFKPSSYNLLTKLIIDILAQ